MHTRLRRRYWIAALACLCLAGTATTAEPQRLTARDADAVRNVVEAQLKAMAADDAERAFSYATPALRLQFGGAERFMTMIRQGYPMVVRPAEVVFFKPEPVDGGGAVQLLRLRDAAGRSWRATYQLQRQGDQRWRIGGCTVVPDDGMSTT